MSENLADIQNDYDEGQKFSITFKITQNNGDTINSNLDWISEKKEIKNGNR